MDDTKRIIYPSTPYGMEKFYNEFVEAIKDGWVFDFRKGNLRYGATHAVTLFKKVEEDPLVYLEDKTTTKVELKEFAESLGVELPEGMNLPAQMRKYIRENYKKTDESTKEDTTSSDEENLDEE